MLDRNKLIHAIEQLSNKLFVSYADQYTVAYQTWQHITSDNTFKYAIKSAQVPWALPEWVDKLDQIIPVESAESIYRALSVDGSQIYPDRHQGTGCFLINIGTVSILYDQKSSVQLSSVPYVFNADYEQENVIVSPEFIDCRRQEFEFEKGCALAHDYLTSDVQSIVLFDGSLIFWSLLNNDPLKRIFLQRYNDILLNFSETKIVWAHYISLPKNKEVSHLLRAALCDFDANNSDAYTIIDRVNDSAVMQFFLLPFHRSTIFKSTLPLCNEYSLSLHPHFFYLHTGSEIVRIEIPAWIADDESAMHVIARCILDQCRKGRGYPVVLAEAHEQAVIKKIDRDFFYQVIAKFSIEQKRRLICSQKNLKKRGLGI